MIDNLETLSIFHCKDFLDEEKNRIEHTSIYMYYHFYRDYFYILVIDL